MQSINSFNTLTNLTISGKNYVYFNLKALSQQFNFDLNKVPISIKILLENLIRNEDGDSITKEMIEILLLEFDCICFIVLRVLILVEPSSTNTISYIQAFFFITESIRLDSSINESVISRTGTIMLYNFSSLTLFMFLYYHNKLSIEPHCENFIAIYFITQICRFTIL